MLDKHIESIIKDLAKDYDKSENYIRNIVYHQFAFIKKCQDEFRPRILIHNLGSFNTSQSKIEAYIKNVINNKRKGNLSYKDAKRIVTYLWKIRAKIKKYNDQNN